MKIRKGDSMGKTILRPSKFGWGKRIELPFFRELNLGVFVYLFEILLIGWVVEGFHQS